MAVNDETRFKLYQRLEEVLGHEEANTMMELVPPVGWADVARQSDIARIDARIDQAETRLVVEIGRLGGRMDRFEGRMDRFDARLDAFQREMRLWFLALVTFVLAAQGLG